ncbi:MAG: hypothetical protein ACI9YL_000203 [Luteibaculaceae bacterium]
MEHLPGFEPGQEIWIREMPNGNYYKLSDGDVHLGISSSELIFQLLFQEPTVVSIESEFLDEDFSELLNLEKGAVRFLEDGEVTFTDVLGRLIQKRKVKSEEVVIIDEATVNFVLFHARSGKYSVLRVVKK